MNYARKPIHHPLYALVDIVSPRRMGALAGLIMLGMIAVATVQTVREQLALLPPPPPTLAEAAAARPAAERTWADVSARLQARFPDRPLETGEVWAMRGGRICGFVNARASNTDNMVRFYTTADGEAHTQHDAPFAIMPVWPLCLNDRWVVLHDGVEKTGFCASDRGRNSTLGRQYACVGWTPNDP